MKPTTNNQQPTTNNQQPTWLKFFHFTFILLIMFSSCKKDDFLNIDENGPQMEMNVGQGIEFNPNGEIVLGNQVANPYNIENMLTAFDEAQEQGYIDCENINVRVTHYYVKFKPENLNQYEVLDSDSTIYLSEYPLDYEILESGNNYTDPAINIEKGEVTYQYTAVPVDYDFIDSIPYEILDDLYIPELDPNLIDEYNSETDNDTQNCIDRLLDLAFYQTGHYDDMLSEEDYDEEGGEGVGQGGKTKNPTGSSIKTKPNKPGSGNNFRRRLWRPSGRIEINDTRLNQNIGLEGVRVQARKWFVVYTKHTDANGNFTMDHRFRRPCHYSIWMASRSNDYAVRKHIIETTHWINGPKIKGAWNYTINDGYDRFAGSVFRGANRYFNQDIDGLNRPDRNGVRQLYIAVDKELSSGSGTNWGVPIIRIGRYFNDNQEYGSDEIFSTTCHETAHTTHIFAMNTGLIEFAQVSKKIRESWAIAVEWRLTHLEYASRGITNYGEENYNPTTPPQFPNQLAYQYWNINTEPDYTSLFINLIDNVNDGTLFFNAPNDQVTGYTLEFIEDNILDDAFGLNSLTQELQANRPAGITANQIDLLLSFY